MTPLITIDQAKDALRIPRIDTSQDTFIQSHIAAASEMVMGYLNQTVEWYDPDTDTLGTVPARVHKATEHLVIYLHDDPMGEAFSLGNLPAPVTAILYPLRKLSLA